MFCLRRVLVGLRSGVGGVGAVLSDSDSNVKTPDHCAFHRFVDIRARMKDVDQSRIHVERIDQVSHGLWFFFRILSQGYIHFRHRWNFHLAILAGRSSKRHGPLVLAHAGGKAC
jgi:hypothetical protein